MGWLDAFKSPNVLGSAVSGGIDLLGNVISNYMNSYNLDKQNEFNIAQWKRANAYNLPINQRARLEQAGINPALALSNISPGITQAVSSGSPQPYVNPMNGVSEYVGQAIQSHFQNENLEMAKKLNDANVSKLNAETVNTLTQNKYLSDLLKSEISKNTANSVLSYANSDAVNTLTPLQASNLQAQINKTAQDTEVQKSVEKLNLYTLKFIKPQEVKQLNASISNLYATFKLTNSKTNLTDAQTLSEGERFQVLVKQVDVLRGQINSLDIDNDQKARLFNYIVMNSQADIDLKRSMITRNNFQNGTDVSREVRGWSGEARNWFESLNPLSSVVRSFRGGSVRTNYR